MKRNNFFLACSFILVNAHYLCAQTHQKLDIERATVFLNGAELTSSASLSLIKGENEVLFNNLAGDVNQQSIIVNATGGVVVESATFKYDYAKTDNISPKVKMLKDSIDLISSEHQRVSNKIAMFAEQLALLQGNNKVSGDNKGLNVAELQKMLDLIGAKMENILNLKSKEEFNLEKIGEHIERLNKQLETEQQIDYQPGGQLLVKFFAREATHTNVIINYVITGAGWEPTYDVMADDIKSPIKLFYKANIYQNSGVLWNNMRLTLSTGNPNEGMQVPVLSPWYLAFTLPRVVLGSFNSAMYTSDVKAESDSFSFAGIVLDSNRGNEGYKSIQKNDATVSTHVATNNYGINTTFTIDLPYTIPSDGQQHLVAVKKYDAPASYRFIAAPKLDKDAFLQAQLTNWEDLNLLPGQTNIFYDGTYVGKANIDTRNTRDTLNISLGRDKKIIVTRDRDKEKRSVRMLGANVRETFAYTISVRNTRKEPVTIVVQDQQPVSNDKDIIIEDKETGGADYDEATGLMTWTLTLAPNETKKLPFGCTVKYPKGKTIDNLR